MLDAIIELNELPDRSASLILAILARMELIDDSYLYHQFAELLIGEDLSLAILPKLSPKERLLREEELNFFQEWLTIQSEHWSKQEGRKRHLPLERAINHVLNQLQKQKTVNEIASSCQQLVLQVVW